MRFSTSHIIHINESLAIISKLQDIINSQRKYVLEEWFLFLFQVIFIQHIFSTHFFDKDMLLVLILSRICWNNYWRTLSNQQSIIRIENIEYLISLHSLRCGLWWNKRILKAVKFPLQKNDFFKIHVKTADFQKNYHKNKAIWYDIN